LPRTSRAAPAARRERSGAPAPAIHAAPAAFRPLDPGGPWLVPLLLLLIARALAWSNLPVAAEDAYITFRFAANFAAGHGLTYNPGERVMGFSSPLWTVWVALGQLLIRDPVPWARTWSVAADVMTLLVMTTLLARHASRAAAWCFAFFFAAWPFFAVVAVSGMESSAMLALIALGALGLERRAAWTGVALGALALIRPEGLVCAAVLALGARPRDRAIGAAIAAAGIGALWAYYGTPIPQSMAAKSVLYGTPGPWTARFWWEWLFPFAMGRWPQVGEFNMLVPLTVVWFAALVPGSTALWRARTTPLALAAAAAVAVWLGYALLGVAYFYWYAEVPLAGLALVASVGLPLLTRSRVLYLACALSILGSWTIARILYIGRANVEAAQFSRVSDYLAAHTRAGDTILLEPIGMIGYRVGDARIVDEVGLVSPAVARRRMEGPGWYTDVVAREHPEWLVVRRRVLEEGEAWAGRGAPFRAPAERDSLLARYAVEESTGRQAGPEDLLVLRRAR